MIKELSLSIGQLLGISTTIATLIAICICAVWSIIFNRIKEGQKAEFQKQIEEQKSEFAKEIENLKAKNDKLNYISKVQFDTEFKIYQEISEAIFYLFDTISKLDKGTNYKVKNYLSIKIDEFENVKEKSNYLSTLLYKYAPFINNAIFEQINLFCNKINNLFKETLNYAIVNNEVRYTQAEYLLEHFKDETTEIYAQKTSLIKTIREYLQSLKVQED